MTTAPTTTRPKLPLSMARHPNCRSGTKEPPPRVRRMTVAAGRARTTAFVVVGAAWFAMMAGSNVATPLYAIYERRVRLLEGGPDARLRDLRARAGALAAALRAALGPARAPAGDGGGLRDGDRRAGAVRGRGEPRVAVRGARGAGPGGRDDQRRGGRGAGRARPGAAGGPRGAVRRARPGGRERLRAADRRDAGRVGAGAARAAVRRVHLPRRRGDGRRAGDPGAGARAWRADHDRAPERPGRDPRACSRA